MNIFGSQVQLGFFRYMKKGFFFNFYLLISATIVEKRVSFVQTGKKNQCTSDKNHVVKAKRLY